MDRGRDQISIPTTVCRGGGCGRSCLLLVPIPRGHAPHSELCVLRAASVSSANCDQVCAIFSMTALFCTSGEACAISRHRAANRLYSLWVSGSSEYENGRYGSRPEGIVTLTM